MEPPSQDVAAAAFADTAMDDVLSAAAPAPSVPQATTREEKMDEVMSFLRFSIKPTTSFEGTILFKFKDLENPNEIQATYLVTVSDKKEVSTKKNASAKDGKITCEVAMSMDDFLHIYSGKASSSDVVKLFYAGRVSISGYAFRTMSNFVSSFDYSTEAWNGFYAWRDHQAQEQHDFAGGRRASGALDEANNVGSPARDFWFYYCRSILERHNISKLQRITWEASLASLFGDQFILDNLHRSVQTRRSFSLPKSGAAGIANKQQVGLISALVGLHAPPSRMENELAHFFHPSATRRHSIATTLSVQKAHDAADVFDFFDEDYVDAVKHSAKHRIHRAQNKDRVDLAAAGMEQLDKLLVALGKDGHRNQQCKTKPRYIPAPELLLREFQSQATELVHVIQEKALGRKRVDRIPPPDMAWIMGSDSGVLVVTDSDAALASMHNPSSARVGQALVVVDRSQTQRRGSVKRDFEVPKQKLIAKLNSLSRDLAKHNAAALPLTFDDHIIFSDYA